MNVDDFEKMYYGVFTPNGDWPECDKPSQIHRIHSHRCPRCACEFGGYIRREFCYICDKYEEPEQ